MSKTQLLVIFVAFCFIVFNKVSGIPEPRDTAHRIFTTVSARRVDNEIREKKQVAYLYFQRKTDDRIIYTNKNVERILGGAPSERMPALAGQNPWPEIDTPDNPRPDFTSNMRVAGARTTPDIQDSNEGHSEQKMLLEFDNMIRDVFGWESNELKECPAFIILGTR
ncbi:Hypothetical predicted protein [Paramuricea clavata]|uniref:Uncharacterized protein n=1 Tax=Paramuricea clavata TaxID=317549 RepID=A0A6S7J5Q4_PARCT|nr:Hypothetical predicted protein [Paramuricea clavata]CAB4040525.1 Hypothetical predicted protein [Paramuricea clavata]